ncbi:Site-specific recombinase XerD [Amycolatopsis pretoriensis]|uniref:Site-specific recombinase XerD n=1 Tax=Amycolatopsis pretoriensis TaxID=218821 RepID=A0A1H5RD86_9PSEU|nr:site-specific integrase [Amycolatopsis pretoriensis]SEF36299.1 Site-specific recombinase XerD [Amycolatopsis pretoriensis]
MAWVEQTGQASWRVRYRRADGTVGSVSGFASRRSAEVHAADVESDQRRQVWIDPAGGRLEFRSWVARWLPVQDLDPRTADNYESYLRCHVLVRFGATPLEEITALDVDAWVKESREAGYATATVASWVKLLSMVMSDAVRQRLIPVNPVRQRRRRGRRSRVAAAERVWATPEQVLRIANQAGVLGGPVARLLIITAAWTGCRWGELAALHRDNLDLDAGRLVVDAEVGSLHESRGRRLGPPKTPSSARTIVLPPFLVRLLRRHLETHPFEFVFTNGCGTWLWRSSFDRRVLRPAIDGGGKAGVRVYAVRPELTFHGLRHSHKTWLIAGGAPEIAQARRLGHHLPNRVVEVYSHVAPEVETRLLADLQRRWQKATRSPYPKGPKLTSAVKSRSRTGQSAKRVRACAGAPIAAGGRDSASGAARERRRRGVRGAVSGSVVLQKCPSRDTDAPVEAGHPRSAPDMKKPLRPAETT